MDRSAFLGGSMLKNSPHHVINHKYPKSLMLTYDTGALFGLIPFRSYFVDYVKCDFPIEDVTKVIE